jgi:hypothetical protein
MDGDYLPSGSHGWEATDTTDHSGATSEERHVYLDSEGDDDYGPSDGGIEFEDALEDEGGGGGELENTFHYILNGVLRTYVLCI